MMQGILLGVAAALCWGFGGVLTKAGLDQVPAALLLLIQLGFSSLLFWIIVVIRKIPFRGGGQTIQLASLGLLEPALAYILGFFGLALTSVSNATIIVTTESFMIMTLAAVLFGHRVPIRNWILAFAAGAGVFLTSQSASLAEGNWLGSGLMIGATFCAACYVVLVDKIGAETNPVLSLALQQGVGWLAVLLLFPFLSVSGDLSLLKSFDVQTWFIALLGGLVQYFLAFWFYLAAMKKIEVDLAGMMLCLTPLAGIAGAIIFLGERLSLQQFLGGAITILSVFFFAWSKYKYSQKSPAFMNS